MKATKYLSLAALALMGTLASCQSDDEATANSFARPANAVGINVTVGSLKGTTRSNPTAGQYDDKLREFNAGDQVCVSTDGQDPVLFQCQDADMQTWAEAEAGKFLLWTQNEMTFKAYYPATPGTSMTNFTLPADQSTEAKIALADYMTRQQTCYNDNGTDIDLDLERKMARVIVKIASFTDQYDEGQQTVSNVRINSQFSGFAEGDGTGDVTAVTPYMQGTGGVNTTFTALVVPGYGDDGADFITLTDALNNTLTVKGFPELREGYSYTYNLTVGKNKILVQSVTVEEWATGTTLAGGQAQEQTGPTYPIALSAVTADYVGSVVTTDGNVYATVSDATTAGKTAVAMIAYVGSGTDHATYTHGLAIALADESDLDWSTAKSTCEGKAAVSDAAWLLPSQNQWKAMFKAFGDNDAYYIGLNTAITSAGGTALQGTEDYWTSSEYDSNQAYFVILYDEDVDWYFEVKDDEEYKVRACLAF